MKKKYSTYFLAFFISIFATSRSCVDFSVKTRGNTNESDVFTQVQHINWLIDDGYFLLDELHFDICDV